MSRIPSLTSRELVAALKRAGYFPSHQTGSHLRMKHASRPPVIVPVHAGDMKRGTQLGIIRQAQFTEDEFLALL